MSELIAVVGAKGGVGKTTMCLNICSALSQLGRQASVIEGNLTNPDIGFYLGQPLVSRTVNEVLNGKIPISEGFLLHSSGARVMQASVVHEDTTRASYDTFAEFLPNLKNYGEIVLVDTPSGMGTHIHKIIQACDSVLLVAGHDIASQSGALRSVIAARELHKPIKGVVLNRALDSHITGARGFIGHPIIGVIPHDEAVPISIHFKYPATFLYPDSAVSRAYHELANYLIQNKQEEPYG